MFGKIIDFLENNFKGGLVLWITSFFSIIVIRLFVEAFLFGFPNQTGAEFLIFFLHTFLFFLLTYLVFLIYLKVLLKIDLVKINSVLLVGFWIIIFPPIIDKVYFGDEKFFDFYIFDGISGLIGKFILFFGRDLSLGITIGPRIQIILALIFLGCYYFYYKKSFLKTIVFVFFSYVLFFVLASIPSFITIFSKFVEGKNILDVFHANVAAMFLSPIRYFSYEGQSFISFMGHKLSLFYTTIITILIIFIQFLVNKNKLIKLIKNIRFPQMFFNWGLFFTGIGLGAFNFPSFLDINLFSILVIINILISILFIWLHSVVINDLFDLSIDKMTNHNRPLIKGFFEKKEYNEIGLIFLIIALISSLVVGYKFFMIIIVYAFLTWVYSAKPFRFKRFFPVSVIISSFSSLLFFIMGYILISKDQSFINFPWSVYWFLFIAYSFIIPIKDIKDIESDKKFGVKTLPVLINEDNTRTIIAILIFSCYIISVYVIREKELLLASILFGGISFWAVINKKISPIALNWWILGIVFIYGLFIVSFMFL